MKYSPAGGRVRVAARAPEAPAAVEITVEDEGPGIAEADLDAHLRAVLPRAGAARARRAAPGSGLAVVKSLVDAHGGTHRVEQRRDRTARE